MRLWRKKQTEHDLQSACIKWCGLMAKKTHKELSLIFAIPNELSVGSGKGGVIKGAKLNREGRKAGVPDLFLPVARGPYHGFFIEMKKKGEKPRENQRQWLESLANQGYKTMVIDNFDTFINELTTYLKLK